MHVEFLEKPRLERNGPADPRGWEWRLLWKMTRSDELFTLGTHSNVVTVVTYSPDGRLISSGSEDRTARLWDVDAQTEVARWPQPDEVRGVTFTPEGNLVAVANGGAVQFFDVVTRAERTGIISDTNDTGTLMFSKDGRTLALLGGQQVRLWEWPSRRALGDIRVPSACRLAFSPEGRELAVACLDGTTAFIELTDGVPVARVVKASTVGMVLETQPLAFAPKTKLLYARGDLEGSVTVWDAVSMKELDEFSAHQSWIGTVAFSADGGTFATASADHTAKLWDAESRQQRLVLRGHRDEVWSIAFAPDGSTVATGGKDGTIRIWSTTSSTRAQHARSFLESDASLILEASTGGAISADGQLLVATSNNHTATIRDFGRMNVAQELDLPANPFRCAVSSTSSLLACSFPNGGITVVHLGRGESFQLPGTDRGLAIRFSADGRTLVGISPAGRVQVWRMNQANSHESFGLKSPDICSFQVSENGREIGIAFRDASYEVWDTETKRRIALLNGHRAPAWASAFAHGGSLVATAGADGTVKLWDRALGSEVATLPGSDLNAYFSVAFSGDGRRLVAGGAHGKVRLWDITSQPPREVATLKAGSQPVSFVAFSKDGNDLLAFSGKDLYEADLAIRGGQVHLWRAPGSAEVAAAEEAAARRK